MAHFGESRCSKQSPPGKIRTNGMNYILMMSKAAEQEEETLKANDKVQADDLAVNGG